MLERITAMQHRGPIFLVSLALCLVFLISTLYLGYAYVHNPIQMLEDTKKDAKDQAEIAASEIGTTLAQLVNVSESISSDLNSGKLEDDDVIQRLKDTIQEHPDLHGVAVAYGPHAYRPERRLYAPYYVKMDGNPQLIQIEDLYDYTRPDPEDGVGPRTIWYHQPLNEGAGWIEPYFGTAAKTLLALHAHPFYRPNASGDGNVPAGVVANDYSLDGVRDLVGSLDLGDTGYGFIVTSKGTIVSHPIRDYLGKNINDLEGTDEALSAINRNMSHGNYQIIYNNFTRQTSWVFYEPVPSTDWTLGVVFVEDEILRGTEVHQRQLLTELILSLMAFLFFLSVILFGAYKGGLRSLWAVAIGFSVLCIVGTSFMWYLALESPNDEEKHDVIVLDEVGLEAALHKQISGSKAEETPICVPTGIFLQSLEFSTANNVIMTGYIWQKYPDNSTTDPSCPGFILPELTGVDTIEFKESYNHEGVIGWYFRVVLRQQFDYSNYPFDREDVWIRLWPSDFCQNAILTPDLGSYDVIRPDLKPGLEQDVVLEGWNIQNSFFSYRNNGYNTNFGVGDYGRGVFPELYFNIGIKRNFVGTFMSDFVPIVVVAFLLFAVLMISTGRKRESDLYGFSSSTVLAYCAALFFVLIVSQFSLRQELPTKGIIYLEYFYFVLYFSILAVSVNSILLASKTRYKIVHYRDNLILKLLYWPFISGLIFVFTLVDLY